METVSLDVDRFFDMMYMINCSELPDDQFTKVVISNLETSTHLRKT